MEINRRDFLKIGGGLVAAAATGYPLKKLVDNLNSSYIPTFDLLKKGENASIEPNYGHHVLDIEKKYLDTEAKLYSVPGACYDVLDGFISLVSEKINDEDFLDGLKTSLYGDYYITKYFEKINDVLSHATVLSSNLPSEYEKYADFFSASLKSSPIVRDCDIGSYLYLSALDNLKLRSNVHLVSQPHHLLLYFEDGKTNFYWETTRSYGNKHSEQDVLKKGSINIIPAGKEDSIVLANIGTIIIGAASILHINNKDTEDEIYDNYMGIAQNILSKSIEIHPTYEGLYNRGNLYDLMGKKTEAIADFKTCLEIAPEDETAQWYLVKLLKENGNVAEAETLSENFAHDISPLKFKVA